jgi:hypothetical protein
MAKFVPVSIVKTVPKSQQIIALNKQAMLAMAAGKTAQAMKLVEEASKLNQTISHRSGGEGSEASIARNEVKLQATTLPLGYYRVKNIDGKKVLFSLPIGKQANGDSFVIPRYKAAVKANVTITTPVKPVAKKATKPVAKKATTKPVVEEVKASE